MYFVAVNWLQVTDGHAVIVLDTHSNLQLNAYIVEEKYIGYHLQLDCHGHINDIQVTEVQMSFDMSLFLSQK